MMPIQMRAIERVAFWAAAGVGAVVVLMSFVGLCMRPAMTSAAPPSATGGADVRDLGVGLALLIVALLVNLNASVRELVRGTGGSFKPDKSDVGRNGNNGSAPSRSSKGKSSPAPPPLTRR